MKRWARRAATSLLAVAAVTLVPTATAIAHPLGNFTTNSYLGVTVSPEEVTIGHVLDLAEIPTLRAGQAIDGDGDGEFSDRETGAYLEDTCASAAADVELVIDGVAVPLRRADEGAITFQPGEAGLDTLRMECPLAAEHALGSGVTQVEVRQPSAGSRIGWHEITLVGEGARVLESDVPTQSISNRLSVYPDDRIASPLDVRTATARLQPGGSDEVGLAVPTAVPEGLAHGLERLNGWFTGLVAVEEFSLSFGLLAVLVAMGLGTLHALAPGHGKTVMAAYLVGRQGTTRDALTLGATVAVTHTLGVFLLGVILSASQSVSPEQIYPWLGAGSGALFALVGVTLLRQALKNRSHDHAHSHVHAHSHDHGHSHDHAPSNGLAHSHGPAQSHVHAAGHDDEGEPPDARSERRRSTGWRNLLAPGLAGGLVPSPSALLVLLGGFAIGRAWFGVGLVVAYGIGMAATLVGAGYLLLRARHRIQRAVESSGGGWTRAGAVFRWLPIITSGLIIVGGFVIVGRSLLAF